MNGKSCGRQQSAYFMTLSQHFPGTIDEYTQNLNMNGYLQATQEPYSIAKRAR
jgi:hypothetical protein